MPGVHHQDDKLALVHGVEHPVITNPDPQHAMRTGDHLRRSRPRIRSQPIGSLADPPAHRRRVASSNWGAIEMAAVVP
jgi:hypothetical protein